MEEQCTYEKLLSAPAQHGYMSPIKQVWVYVVLFYMIRITVHGCAVLLDLAHIKTEYSIEKGSVNEEYTQAGGQDGCNCRLVKLY